jgi:hypothetical protein
MPRYQQTEDLARYGQAGLPGISKDIPGLNVTGIVQSPGIAAALNRVSDFAFRSIEPAVQRQAAQYAFDNPITIEQLREGAKDGLTAKDFAPLSGSEAANTIRKIQAAQLQTELHAELVNKHADVMRKSDAGQIPDVESLKREFSAPINGAVKALASLDPEAAIRLQASASASASAAYKHGLANLSKDAANLAEITSNRLADNQVTIYKAYFNSLFGNKNQQDVVDTHAAYEDAHFLALSKSASAAGDFPGAKRLVADNRKEYEKVRVNEFAEQASAGRNTSEALEMIKQNDFGHMTPLWNALKPDEKTAVAQTILKSQFEKITGAKQDREAISLVNQQRVATILITGDRSREAKTILSAGVGRGDVTPSQFNAHFDRPSQKPTYAQEELYSRLASDSASGRRINEQDRAKLTPGQIIDLNNVEYKTDAKSAQIYRDLSAGDTGSPIQNISIADSLAARKIIVQRNFNVFVNESNPDGTRKYSDMQASEAAVTKWRGSVEFVSAKSAVERTRQYFKKFAPDFNPDTHDVDAWMGMKGKKIDKDDDSYNRLQTQYKRYKDAQDKIGPE